MLDVFLNGQYHAASLQRWIIIPTFFFSLILIIENRIKEAKWYLISLFIILNSVVYGFISWHKISAILEPIKEVIPMQFERFHWLNPMLWHVLFAKSLTILSKHLRIGRYLVLFILSAQLFYSFSNHELWINRKSPSVKEFYAENQFKKVREVIGKPQSSYRVASLGIHPSISLYNGFYTIDGYSSDYPLAYKHRFRKIISKELEKSKKLKDYFENYAARVYLFCGSDIGYLNYKNNNIVLNNLEFDIQSFKDLNCQYILSSVKIDPANISYRLHSVVKDEKSAWDIYVYSII
jgi:hypothetical protein